MIHRRLAHLLILAAAFIVSVLSVSNLMPLLLEVITEGLNFTDGSLIVGYLVAGTVAVATLARDMYRLDKKAGRIRNKVGWFE